MTSINPDSGNAPGMSTATQSRAERMAAQRRQVAQMMPFLHTEIIALRDLIEAARTLNRPHDCDGSYLAPELANSVLDAAATLANQIANDLEP